MNRREIKKISISAILLIMAIIVPGKWKIFEFILYLASYIIAGYDVILKSIKGIIRGDVFNENFLMAIASIGAFCIGEYPEGVCVMLLYCIGELFQDYAVEKSRNSVSELMDICPDKANVLRNGEYITVSPEEITVGEIIMIKPGERVPLDAVVTEGASTLDTSALTGESLPKSVEKGDIVLSGSINKSGVIYASVSKEYYDSTAAKILELVENASSKKTKSENFITKFARYYTPCVVIAAVLFAVIPPLVFDNITFSAQLYRALSFLVVSCPCALVISVPLGFFGGIGASAKEGVLIKGSNYLEALSHAEIAVFDKTGTLTEGSFKVRKVNPLGITENELLEIASYAESISNHPIAISVLQSFGGEINKELITNAAEIPGLGVCADVSGSKILVGNERLMEKAGIKTDFEKGDGTTVFVALDEKYVGSIVISDSIKSNTSETMKKLKRLGIKKTVMLTGDIQSAGEKAAKTIGIDEAHCELLPADKVGEAEMLASELSSSGKLLYAGDGINDAPVLARADIGVAMGALGSDAAIEAADIVIMTDDIAKLPTAIAISKKTVKIVKQNIIFALSVKAAVLILCSFGLASMWAAVFADVGVSMLAVMNSLRVLKR